MQEKHVTKAVMARRMNIITTRKGPMAKAITLSCGDDFRAIADAIREAVKPYRAGLPGLAIYLRR